jgi:tetratricopeptide (TPR) repeat protein
MFDSYLRCLSIACAIWLNASLETIANAQHSNGLRGTQTQVAPQVESPATMSESQTAQRLLHEAFRHSQQAKSTDNFTQIIELCEQAKGFELGKDEAVYLKNVSAWAHNRRGELLSEEATTLLNNGNEADAEYCDKQALADFNAAIRIDSKRWKALHNRGVSYGLLGYHDKAVADFTAVIELNPQYANAWFNRAEIHMENGRINFAVSDYTKALEITHDDTAAYAGRARAYALGKRYTQAIADFASALELEPDNADYLVERGELYARRGEWKLAAGDYRHSIELNPQSAHAYRCAAWLMSTCPEAKFRNSKLALDAAHKALQLAKASNELDYSYFDTLAAAHANAGNFMEAKRYLRSAIDSAPEAAASAMHARLSLYAAYNPYRVGSTSTTMRTVSSTTKATNK